MKSPFSKCREHHKPFGELNNVFCVMFDVIKPKDLPLFKVQYRTAFDMLKKEHKISGGIKL